jgi:hypothetical protein
MRTILFVTVEDVILWMQTGSGQEAAGGLR